MHIRKVILYFLLFAPVLLKAQQEVRVNENISANVTTFNIVTGYIEVRDAAYFERLDAITRQTYEEHMGYYNKGLQYYNEGKDYESAYFYFNKAFAFGWFAKIKAKPDNEILQNKAYYQLMAITKCKNPKRGDVIDAWELVQDHCDPERKRVAEAQYKSWKCNR